MSNNHLLAVLPLLTAAVVEKIMDAYQLDEDTAIQRFYQSELYGALECEETKVWHYSSCMLFDLYQQEQSEGKLVLPEY